MNMTKSKENEKMRKMAAIVALSANYDQTMQKDLMRIWLDLLEKYSAQEVERSVNIIIQEYEYKTRPPFAILKKAIDKITGRKRIDPEKAVKMMAEAEWDKLIDDLSYYGRYREPNLDPTTAFVLRGMGGWDTACSWDIDKLEWRHKEFVEKWEISYGNEEYMELGASGVREMIEGPQSIGEIIRDVYVKGEIE